MVLRVLAALATICLIGTLAESHPECSGDGIAQSIISEIKNIADIDPFMVEDFDVNGGSITNISVSGLSRIVLEDSAKLSEAADGRLDIVFSATTIALNISAKYQKRLFKGSVAVLMGDILAEFDAHVDVDQKFATLVSFTILRYGIIDVKVDGSGKLFTALIRNQLEKQQTFLIVELNKRVPRLFNNEVNHIDFLC